MPLDNVKHVILILSGKGGVGKSSVTTQLALSLSLAGKSVGILDVDLTGPSIPRLLGLEDAKITATRSGGWKPVAVHTAQTLEPLKPPSSPPDAANGASQSTTTSTTPPICAQKLNTGPLYAASLAFLLPSRGAAVVWRGPKKTAMVRQFLSDVIWPSSTNSEDPRLDYLLIDTPPGTSDEHISLAETLLSGTTSTNIAGAVVVTTPQAVSLADVRKELNFCRQVGLPVLGVLENMAGFLCECCGEPAQLFAPAGHDSNENHGAGEGEGGGEAMAREFKHPFLGRVPLDLGWGRVVEEGGWGWPTSSSSSSDDVNATMNGGEAKSKALLVDRYRSCTLSRIFADLARDIIKMVDEKATA